MSDELIYNSNINFIRLYMGITQNWIAHCEPYKKKTRFYSRTHPKIKNNPHLIRHKRNRNYLIYSKRFKSDIDLAKETCNIYSDTWQIVPDDYILYDTDDFKDYNTLKSELKSVSLIITYHFIPYFDCLLKKIYKFILECNPELKSNDLSDIFEKLDVR